MSDSEDSSEENKAQTVDKWARLNCTIRPHNMDRLDKLVAEYPFRSRSEAVEIALDLLFSKYEKVGVRE